jgi:hypothetical protein
MRLLGLSAGSVCCQVGACWKLQPGLHVAAAAKAGGIDLLHGAGLVAAVLL